MIVQSVDADKFGAFASSRRCRASASSELATIDLRPLRVAWATVSRAFIAHCQLCRPMGSWGDPHFMPHGGQEESVRAVGERAAGYK